MRQQSDGVVLYTGETTFTWWRKAFMHIETSQDGVERCCDGRRAIQRSCFARRPSQHLETPSWLVETCIKALSHQVKVVKACIQHQLRLTAAPYVVLWDFCNYHGTASKNKSGCSIIERRLGNFSHISASFWHFWWSKSHFWGKPLRRINSFRR